MPDKYPLSASATPRSGRKTTPAQPERADAWPAWLKSSVTGKKQLFQRLADVPEGSEWCKDGVPVHSSYYEEPVAADIPTKPAGEWVPYEDHKAVLEELKELREENRRLAEANDELLDQLTSERTLTPDDEGDPEGKEEWMSLEIEPLRRRATAAGLEVDMRWSRKTLQQKYREFLAGDEA